jgi:putative DNA primase/helicase
VFVGTTNERNYLKDHTGNRRFLPVSCGTIDLALARKVREQLFAEALFEYRKGTQPVLSATVEAVAEREQRERVVDDPWAKPVRDYVRRHLDAASQAGKMEMVVSIADILTDGLHIEIGRQDRAAETRVGTILARLGAEKKRRRIDGRPKYVSVLPVSPEEGEAPPHEDGRLL